VSSNKVPRWTAADRGGSLSLRTVIATMAVTSVLTVLLVMAYLLSGCRLGDPPH
jgi:hypothetical protein